MTNIYEPGLNGGSPIKSTLPTNDHPAALALREPEADADNIPLSEISTKLLQTLGSNPRKRVFYRTSSNIIEHYEPGSSFYLDAETRTRLLHHGQVYAQERPTGTYVREVSNRLLIDLSWNSSRLEGNTYSLLETQRLLEAGMAGSKKNALETQMILNHKTAIDFMIDNIADLGFSPYCVLNLHAMLSDNILGNSSACGALRNVPVASGPIDTGKSTCEPLQTSAQIDEQFTLVLAKAQAIDNPFEQALFTLIHLPYLQPFEDVNKRTARLAANIGLFRNNLCPLSFIDVPVDLYANAMLGIYELKSIDLMRDLFVWAYMRSASRYNAYLQVATKPDPIRIKYRTLAHDLIAQIVMAPMDKSGAIACIREQVQRQVPHIDQSRLIEAIETQLMSLREGNIARFGLRPSQFQAWQITWA